MQKRSPPSMLLYFLLVSDQDLRWVEKWRMTCLSPDWQVKMAGFNSGISAASCFQGKHSWQQFRFPLAAACTRYEFVILNFFLRDSMKWRINSALAVYISHCKRCLVILSQDPWNDIILPIFLHFRQTNINFLKTANKPPKKWPSSYPTSKHNMQIFWVAWILFKVLLHAYLKTKKKDCEGIFKIDSYIPLIKI